MPKTKKRKRSEANRKDLQSVVARAKKCATATGDWSEERVIDILEELLEHVFGNSDTTYIETGRIRLEAESFQDGSGWCVDVYYNLGSIFSKEPDAKA